MTNRCVYVWMGERGLGHGEAEQFYCTADRMCDMQVQLCSSGQAPTGRAFPAVHDLFTFESACHGAAADSCLAHHAAVLFRILKANSTSLAKAAGQVHARAATMASNTGEPSLEAEGQDVGEGSDTPAVIAALLQTLQTLQECMQHGDSGDTVL